MIRNTKILTVFCLTFSVTILLSALFLPLDAYGAAEDTICKKVSSEIRCKKAIAVGDHVQVTKWMSPQSGTCHGDVTSISGGLAKITIDPNDPDNVNCKLLIVEGKPVVEPDTQKTTAVIENGCVVPDAIEESALGAVLDFGFTDESFLEQENILHLPDGLGGGVFETTVLEANVQIKNTGVEEDEVSFDVNQFDVIDAAIQTSEGDTGLIHLSWLGGNGIVSPDGISANGVMRASSENFGDLFDMKVILHGSGCEGDNDLDFGFWGFIDDSIDFGFEVTVDEILGDDQGLLLGILAENDIIRGSYNFRPDATDLTNDPNFGTYDNAAFEFQFDSVAYENIPPFLSEVDAIFVVNNFLGTADGYGVQGTNFEQQSGPGVAEFGFMFLGIDDLDQTVFDDDSLPLTPPDLDEFEERTAQIFLTDFDLGENDFSISSPQQLRSQLETQQTVFIEINGVLTSLEKLPTPPPPPTPTPQPSIVGGEFLLTDSTALILAGAQTFSWMIPVVLSALGIGLFVFRRSENS